MVNFHTSRRARLKTLVPAAICTLSLLFSSCEFLALNIMPSYLSRDIGYADLESALKKAGLSSGIHINRLQFLSTGGHGYAVAIASDGSAMANAFVDLDTMKVKKVVTGTYSGDTVVADMQGYIAIGKAFNSTLYQFNPGTLEYTATPAFSSFFGYSATGINYSGSTYMIWGEGSSFNFTLCTSWASAVPYTTNPIDPAYSLNANASSAVLDGSKVRVLLLGDGTNAILTFPSVSIMENTYSQVPATYPSLYDHPNVGHAVLPSSDDKSGWMTADGAILLHHDNGTSLTRYDGDSGEELDSCGIGDSDGSAYGFSPDGKRWLMYEGATGKLHLLRTWW